MVRAFVILYCLCLLLPFRAWAQDVTRPVFAFQKRDGLPNVNRKLVAGGPVTIAYLGGSITLQKGWRVLIGEWFSETYPTAKINGICAAIGGTGSSLGAYRVGKDVIAYHPDLVFVEFAVNDYNYSTPDIHSNMEGIVRQIWKANPETDICFVYTISEPMLPVVEGGHLVRSADAMEDVAIHYGIPTIFMGSEIPKLIQDGKLIFKHDRPTTDQEKAQLAGKILFTGDGTHPYEPTGHVVYLEALKNALPSILLTGIPGSHPVGTPLVSPNAEDAMMVPLSDLTLSGKWEKLESTDPMAERFKANLPELWKGSPGAKIAFSLKGSAFGLYLLFGPDGGKVAVTVDGARTEHVLFDSYCNDYRLASTDLVSGLDPHQTHTVTIELLPEPPDRATLIAPLNEADFKAHPEKYTGVALYVGDLLVRGELFNSPASISQ